MDTPLDPPLVSGEAGSTEPATRPARVLVVDDSALTRRMVAAVLRAAGHTVETADSGEAAFGRCIAEPFDLLVSDVTMGALSGMQLCRLLREEPATASMPIILLTAGDEPRNRFWARRAGADAYVLKERTRERLLPVVNEQLSLRPPYTTTAPPRRLRDPDPLPRLAEVLERRLFRAEVASEVHGLIRQIGDRSAFCRALLRLTSEVAGYAYLTLCLEGPSGPGVAIHARGPFPAQPTAAALRALGLEAAPERVCELIHEGPPEVAGRSALPTGEMVSFPVLAGDERLGTMSAFAGLGRLSGRDHETIAIIARELGVVVKSLLLLEQTRHLADTDELTGLANRRRAGERLEHEIERARRTERPLTVALCDIDHFKAVNDEHGHSVGDDVLRRIGEELRARTRAVDLVARWGGEELLVVLTEADPAGGRVVAERLRLAVAGASKEVLDGGVTMSVGLASWVPEIDANTLVDRADRALYDAKEGGRNRTAVYEEG